MKAKIFSFVKISIDSMVASVHLARYVSKTLDLDIVWDETIAEEPLDVLLIVNGAYAFAGNTLLAALGRAIETAGRVVWIQQDYTIIPPKDESGAESPFRKAFRNRMAEGKPAVDYWTTVKPMSNPGRAKSGHRLGEFSTYVNWNCLTTIDYAYAERPEDRAHADVVVYYGAFRKDRERYFDRYFKSPSNDYHIWAPNQKFSSAYLSTRISHFGKFSSLHDQLKTYGAGLYLEDKKSHEEFHSPANRFYEMMSAGVPIIFQPESMRMMAQAGYEVGDFVAYNPDDVAHHLAHNTDMVLEQRDRWWQKVLDERKSLDEITLSAWRKYV